MPREDPHDSVGAGSASNHRKIGNCFFFSTGSTT